MIGRGGLLSRRAMLAAALLVSLGPRALTAQADTSTRVCDSIIAKSRVDSVLTGLFVAVRRIDGPYLSTATLNRMALRIGAAFTLPSPFQLSVFAGPARTHLLRPVGGDTLPDVRTPSVIGIYSVGTAPHDPKPQGATERSTLMPGFDAAAMTAIAIAVTSDSLFHPPDDSLELAVQFSTDSSAGAVRLLTAYFPRMPVVDAVASRGNVRAQFPDSADADGADRGEVLLRFVVTREGQPALNTVEILRATSTAFLRSALNVLPNQHFRPAVIHGCAISETIEYPFTFVHSGAPPTGRH